MTPSPAPDLRQALAALSAPSDQGGSRSPGSAGTAGGRQRQAKRGTTSALSIDETLLLHSAGWEPVDLVFGVSWWSIPWGVWQWQSGEVEEASAAFAGAMGQASALLRDECAKAGGSGVLGVDVETRVASHHVAVTLSGTAVRPVGEARGGSPFTSDMSARDFVLLTRAGWWPLGVVAGASFVIAPRRSARQWAAQQTQNIELPNLTQALYLARERAMERLQEAGTAVGADGVVAVKMTEGPLRHSNRILQFVTVGTGVHLRDGVHRTIQPSMVVGLDELVRQFEAANLRRPPGR